MRVAGTGLRAEWTRRAVARLGLNDPETAIEVTEDAFCVSNARGERRLENLGELLAELQKNRNGGAGL